MKKYITFKSVLSMLSILLSAAVISGCGTDNDNMSAPPENAPPQDETQAPGDENTTEEGVNQDQVSQNGHTFTKFDLDVEYKDNKKFEAEYEAEGNGEAEIKDTLNDKSSKGDKAYKELSPLLEQLKIDANSDEQEVVTQVLEVFGLEKDYTEFELEVTYEDGTSKEYKLKQ
ncbi:YusW family protein [Bacillus tianshenii]|uniref:YusW family protein n=1 Tax=Sutcliffiella tianshenii TaxID=1463404 RepID=UPI001CD26B36|nr:YusW family protein [Bacillus tianshenii]MCA1319539.1 YusW family protein [Bacillus tianshenii]